MPSSSGNVGSLLGLRTSGREGSRSISSVELNSRPGYPRGGFIREGVGAGVTRLNALTGLRFVAAAMILIHHASVFGIKLPALALDHGVSFFFVLSGFVLAYVHPSIGSAYELRAFLWNRVVRVWPAHLVMLFVALILLNLPITWAFPLNFFLLQAWVPVWDSYFSYNAVSWSISTELGFYLAFP